jgi:hypothetical protein
METVAQPRIDPLRRARNTFPTDAFRETDLDGLPAPAAAFLRHAIAPGTPLPTRIRLIMHGQIRVGTWLPFRAEQVIDAERGFWWTARVAGGIIRGRDSFDHGQGETRVGLGGVIPLMSADGPDVTRSALGRMLAERAVWLPGTLLPKGGARWHAPDLEHAVAIVPVAGGYQRLSLGIETDGRLRDLTMARWGRSHGRYDWIPFGLRAEAEATFGRFTLVSQGQVGWWYGTDKWAAGEFFRFTIDHVHPF